MELAAIWKSPKQRACGSRGDHWKTLDLVFKTSAGIAETGSGNEAERNIDRVRETRRDGNGNGTRGEKGDLENLGVKLEHLKLGAGTTMVLEFREEKS